MSTPHLGDHVRIVLGARPDALDKRQGLDLGCGNHVYGHLPEHQGRIGTVSECAGGFPCRYGAVIDHGYFIVYDEGYTFDEGIAWAGHFAAEELEPVTATASLEDKASPR